MSSEFELTDDSHLFELKNHEETIKFFKHGLDEINQKILKQREKLDYLRKVYQQFSLLLDKTVRDNFGELYKPEIIDIFPEIPQPKVHSSSLKELTHLVNTTAPSDVIKYINNTSVVERLIFTHDTLFNNSLLSALTRASPDIRVSFIEAVFKKLNKCSDFLDKLLPVLSKVALHPSLTQQLSEPEARYSDFFDFYEESLKKIGKLCGFTKCKLVFNSQDGSYLIYPTRSFNHMIPIDGLLGSLLSNENPTRIQDPLNQTKIKRAFERCVFDSSECILSCRFSYGNIKEHGLLIIFNEKPFTESDETIISLVSSYVSPALHQLSNVFLQVIPCDFVTVSECLSELYQTEDTMNTIGHHFLKIVNAEKYKIYLAEEDDDLKSVSVLPKTKSLIRSAYENGTAQCIESPRTNKLFDQNIDDLRILSRIEAMLIIPIKCHGLIVALYNSTSSNVFTPRQIQMARSYAEGVPFVVEQYISKKKMSQAQRTSIAESSTVSRFISDFPLLAEAASIDCLFEQAEVMVDNARIEVIEFDPDENIFKYYPKEQTSTAIPELTQIKEPQLFQLDGEFILAVPSGGRICTITTKELMDPKSEHYAKLVANAILTLFPWTQARIGVKNLIKYQAETRNLARASTDSLAKLIGSRVACHFFDPPLKSQPSLQGKFIINLETSRGIEGSLVFDEEIENDILKEVIVNYADLLTKSLQSCQKVTVIPTELLEMMKEDNVLELFECKQERLEKFLLTVLTICKTNHIDFQPMFERYKYLRNELLPKISVKTMFDKEDIAVILLLVLVRGLDKKWRYSTEKSVWNLAEKIPVRTEALQTFALFFNTDFGIASPKEGSVEKKDSIASKVNDYFVGGKMSEESEVVAMVRIAAETNFDNTPVNKIWIGRSLVLMAALGEGSGELKMMESSEKLIFAAHNERIYVPLAQLYTRNNSFILQITSNIRTNIRKCRGFI